MGIIRYGNQSIMGIHPNAGSGNLISYRRKAGGIITDPNTTMAFRFTDGTLDPVEGIGLALTFTRASTGTYYDSNGILQTAIIDAPRFDHDPTTKAPLGLLIEEARTNLQDRSEDFADPTWSNTLVDVVSNATI